MEVLGQVSIYLHTAATPAADVGGGASEEAFACLLTELLLPAKNMTNDTLEEEESKHTPQAPALRGPAGPAPSRTSRPRSQVPGKKDLIVSSVSQMMIQGEMTARKHKKKTVEGG